MSVLLSVTRLAERFNPLSDSPWGLPEIRAAEIRAAIASEEFCPERHPNGLSGNYWSREKHISRIAFLAVHGWAEPIDINVGVPSLGCIVDWPISDGNHRLCAAIVRGDGHIAASVGGDWTSRPNSSASIAQKPLPRGERIRGVENAGYTNTWRLFLQLTSSA
jgi:hypothetical protein